MPERGGLTTAQAEQELEDGMLFFTDLQNITFDEESEN